MICERCGVRPANISLTKIINGEKSEAHLCDQCAAEIGEFGLGSAMGMSFGNFFSGLLNPSFWGQPTTWEDKTCPTCGLTYDRFRESGRLGCPDCYDTFDKELNQLLRRIQGGVEHKGKVPQTGTDREQKISELERLQAELKQAIETENYERAAELRDAIQALQKEGA